MVLTVLMALPYILLIAIICGVVVTYAARNYMYGIYILLSVYLCEVLCGSEFPSWVISGFHVYLSDLGFVALFSAAVARVNHLRRRYRECYWLYMLGALHVLAIVRGIFTEGIGPAISCSRYDRLLLTGLLYFSSFSYDSIQIKKVINVWYKASICLLAIISASSAESVGRFRFR